jgi:3-hydroxybutyryl-CoA dehydrogenase
MGRQISLQFATYGNRIVLIDPIEQVGRDALEYVRDTGRELAEQKILPEGSASAFERVELKNSVEGNLDGCWLVLEAVPERMELKRELYPLISRNAPENAILATNSSSFRSGLLADVTKRPERLMNMHFLNHPWQRPAVELMTSGYTDEALLGKAYRFLRDSGLRPVIVQGESTGFLFNRIWRAVKKESLKVVAEGHGVPEDVDRFWCMSTGLKLGPFALMDRVGLDVVLDIERHYASESGDPKDEPPEFLVKMVEQGRLGLKTGHGFYEYPDPPFEHPDWPYDD